MRNSTNSTMKNWHEEEKRTLIGVKSDIYMCVYILYYIYNTIYIRYTYINTFVCIYEREREREQEWT